LHVVPRGPSLAWRGPHDLHEITVPHGLSTPRGSDPPSEDPIAFMELRYPVELLDVELGLAEGNPEPILRVRSRGRGLTLC
jgi:hypothetical protein